MMAFPLVVEIALGADLTDPDSWVWTDVSEFARAKGKPVIKRGRADQQSTSTASTLTITLDNDDGRFCRLNPLSPYFGQLMPNTPIRVAVDTDTRFTGYISDLPPTYEQGTTARYVDISAAGVMRRLEKSDQIQSPLRAYVLGTSPSGYWPLEDLAGSLSGASGLDGGKPMQVYARAGNTYQKQVPAFGKVDGIAGSDPAPEWPQGYLSLRANVPRTSNTSWTVACCFRADGGSATTGLTLNPLVIYTDDGSGSSGIAYWVIDLSVNDITLTARTDVGASIAFKSMFVDDQPYQPFNGDWHSITFRAYQSGTSVNYELQYDDRAQSGLFATTTTLTPVVKVDAVDWRSFSTTLSSRSVAHVAVWDGNPSGVMAGYHVAAHGYVGERAVDRMVRVTAQAGIPFTATEGSLPSEPLGAQPLVKVLEILRDAEHADGGALYERLDGRLGYLARSHFYEVAQDTDALELGQGDLAAIEIHDDDGQRVNDATVTRAGGSSSRVTTHWPPLEPPEGRYQNSDTVNIATDGRTLDYAQWAVHRGTVDAYQYPMLGLNLHAHPELIPAWTALEVGDRIMVEPPPGAPPDLVDLIVEGYTETLDALEWMVSVNTSPASAYRVGIADDPILGRLDTAGSMLVTGVDATSTTLLVATTSGPSWVTTANNPGEFPLEIRVAGERMTVSGIAPGIRDAFGRTVSGGWGATDTGQTWLNDGGTGSNYATNGSVGQHILTAVNVPINSAADIHAANVDLTCTLKVGSLAAGADIQCGPMIRWENGSNHYLCYVRFRPDQKIRLWISKRVAGTFTTLLNTDDLPNIVHSTSTVYGVRFQVIGPILSAKIWDSTLAEPKNWQAITYDTALSGAVGIGLRSALAAGCTTTLPVTCEYDTILTSNPQEFTVERSVNGVIKPQSEGAAVTLWQPLTLGL